MFLCFHIVSSAVSFFKLLTKSQHIYARQRFLANIIIKPLKSFKLKSIYTYIYKPEACVQVLISEIHKQLMLTCVVCITVQK